MSALNFGKSGVRRRRRGSSSHLSVQIACKLFNSHVEANKIGRSAGSPSSWLGRRPPTGRDNDPQEQQSELTPTPGQGCNCPPPPPNPGAKLVYHLQVRFRYKFSLARCCHLIRERLADFIREVDVHATPRTTDAHQRGECGEEVPVLPSKNESASTCL